MALLVRATATGMLRPRAPGPPPPSVTVDVNRARVAELMTLPGIGRLRAEALVLHRVRHGPFRSVEDLLGVDGIGPGVLAELRPHACVRTEDRSGSGL